MKELSIEEKAKHYDKAIERAEGLIDFCSDSELKTLEYVFPELKESEDEEIRKEIISALKYANHKGVYDKHLAWLEKQGQTFTKKDVDNAYLKGVCDAKQELEKQGEQKSVSCNEEDKKIINFLRKCVQEPMGTNFLGDIRKADVLAWLEKQGKKQQKTLIWKHWKDGIAGNGEGKPMVDLRPLGSRVKSR